MNPLHHMRETCPDCKGERSFAGNPCTTCSGEGFIFRGTHDAASSNLEDACDLEWAALRKRTMDAEGEATRLMLEAVERDKRVAELEAEAGRWRAMCLAMLVAYDSRCDVVWRAEHSAAFAKARRALSGETKGGAA